MFAEQNNPKRAAIRTSAMIICEQFTRDTEHVRKSKGDIHTRLLSDQGSWKVSGAF